MKTLPLLLLLLPVLGFAGPPKTFPQQNQSQDQSQIASGGSVSNVSSESRVFALSGNITQVQVSDCFVPARRFGRSQNYLWGLFSISALSTLDKDCVEAKVRILEAQARLIEAQNEAKRLEDLRK